jgi:hypothetical protein
LKRLKSIGYFTLKFIGSIFHTLEQEYFDFGSIPGEVDVNIGSETYGDVSLLKGWVSIQPCKK